MAIKESLQNFGLSDKEISVYTTILKYGSISPAEITKITKIKRPSVYVALESLLSRSIVAKDLQSKKLRVIPLPPDNLNMLIKKDRDLLKEKENNVSELINEIKQFSSAKKYPVPKLSFIEKDKIDEFLFDNTEKWFKSCKDAKICYGFQDINFANKKKDWINWVIQESERKNYQALLISNNDSIEKSFSNKNNVRKIFFSEKTNFTSTTWVVGDYIIMISLKGEQEYLVEIHDEEMSHNLREVFKELLLKQ